MGLEYVEMIMGIEGEFGITIRNEDAESLAEKQLGDMVNYILLKVYGWCIIPDVCLCSHIFYTIRKVMVKSLGMLRNSISPRNELEDLFPESLRRCQWEKLSSETGLRLPGLQCSNTTKEYIHATSWGMMLGGIFSLPLIDKCMIIPLNLIVGSLINYFVNEPKMIKEKSVLFPEGMKTLRDLIMTTMNMNMVKYSRNFPVLMKGNDWVHWNLDYAKVQNLTVEEIEETWERLCDVVAVQTGFDKKKLDLTTTIEEICYYHYNDGSPVLW